MIARSAVGHDQTAGFRGRPNVNDNDAPLFDKFNAPYPRRARLTPRTLERLQSYRWPGNVRELENAMRRLVVFDVAERALVGNRAEASRILKVYKTLLSKVAECGLAPPARRVPCS
jgi:transcriptional regulator with GAF, ATPase, and Fis domain